MEPKLKIEYMNTGELIPYAGNAKEHPEWQVEQIAQSIRQFGFNDPVGVWTRPDGRPEIVEGHGRVLAAKELGIKRLPVVRLDHLDDEGRRAYTHIHNQTNLTTGFDWEALDAEIASMSEIDWSAFGFEWGSGSYFDGLSVEDFNDKNDEKQKSEFAITFIFPASSKECVDRYVKEAGKERIVADIVEKAERWA